MSQQRGSSRNGYTITNSPVSPPVGGASEGRRAYARVWLEGSRQIRPKSAPSTALSMDNVEMPESKVPERFHLRDAGPLEDTVGSVTFPSKQPAGRWEVMQLAHVLETMCKELSAPPSWNDPSEADPEELLESNLDELYRRPWDVYSVAWRELVRQAWVHCTERGVLMEKVRVACNKMFEDTLSVAQHLQSYSKAASSPNQPMKRQAKELRAKVQELQDECEKLKNELNSARADQRSAEASRIRAEKRAEELSTSASAAEERANDAESECRDLRASYQRSEHEKRRLRDALDSTRKKLEEEARQRESEVGQARSEVSAWRSLTAMTCNAKGFELPKEAASLLSEMGLPQFGRYITLVDRNIARHLLNGLSLKQQAAVFCELGQDAHVFLDLNDPTNAARLLASLDDPSFAAAIMSHLSDKHQGSLIDVLTQKHAISIHLQQYLSRQSKLLQPLDHQPSSRLDAPLAFVLRLLPTSLEPSYMVSRISFPEWPSPIGRNPELLLKLAVLDLASPDSEPIMQQQLDLSLPFSEERLLCLLARVPQQYALLVATCGQFPSSTLPGSMAKLRELGADLSDLPSSSPLCFACSPSEGHVKADSGGLDIVLTWDTRVRHYRLVSRNSAPDVKCTKLVSLATDRPSPPFRSALELSARATLARFLHPLRRLFFYHGCPEPGEQTPVEISPKTFYTICRNGKLKVKEKQITKLANAVAKGSGSADVATSAGGKRGKAKVVNLGFDSFLEVIVSLTVEKSTPASEGERKSTQNQQGETEAGEGVAQYDHHENAKGAHALECLMSMVDAFVSQSPSLERGDELYTNEHVKTSLHHHESALHSIFNRYAETELGTMYLWPTLSLCSQAGLLNTLSKSVIAAAFYDVAVNHRSNPHERINLPSLALSYGAFQELVVVLAHLTYRASRPDAAPETLVSMLMHQLQKVL